MILYSTPCRAPYLTENLLSCYELIHRWDRCGHTWCGWHSAPCLHSGSCELHVPIGVPHANWFGPYTDCINGKGRTQKGWKQTFVGSKSCKISLHRAALGVLDPHVIATFFVQTFGSKRKRGREGVSLHPWLCLPPECCWGKHNLTPDIKIMSALDALLVQPLRNWNS